MVHNLVSRHCLWARYTPVTKWGASILVMRRGGGGGGEVGEGEGCGLGGILVSTLMGHCPLAHMPIYILLLGLFGQYNCCLVFSTNTWIGCRNFSFFIFTHKMRQVGYKVLIIVLKWRKYMSCIYKTRTRPRFSLCVDTLTCSHVLPHFVWLLSDAFHSVYIK